MTGVGVQQWKPVPLPVSVGEGTVFEPYAVAMYGDMSWVCLLAEVVDPDDSIHGGTIYAEHVVLWRNVPRTSGSRPEGGDSDA